MMPLDDYLEAAIEQQWRWGEMDCCMFAGNWILEATGKDPMAPYRGAYRSALEARRLIRARGGLEVMAGAELLRCGFAQTLEPERGDVGVVLQSDDEHAVAGAYLAIFNGRWWIARSLNGIASSDEITPKRAWRILQ